MSEHLFACRNRAMASDEQARSDERLRLLALCTIDGVNWNVLAREAQRPDGFSRLLSAEVAEDSRDARATRQRLAEGLDALPARLDRARGEIDAAERIGTRLVTVLDDEYPSNLRVTSKLPPFLFYRGELRRDDARSVAVVGTRQASPEGIDRARSLAELLVGEGVTVISGLAAGIDTAAHSAALEAGGRTLAVVGTGILSVYPEQNAELADRIAASGAVISQFWPSAPPTRFSFPMRNEVMSGISQGTAVIEAGRTSGAKMQARLALEQGKRAFLMSSLVTDEDWAQDYLGRPGAIEVNSVDDVVGWLRSPEQVEMQSSQRHQLALELV
jgi:DNA processing protein